MRFGSHYPGANRCLVRVEKAFLRTWPHGSCPHMHLPASQHADGRCIHYAKVENTLYDAELCAAAAAATAAAAESKVPTASGAAASTPVIAPTAAPIAAIVPTAGFAKTTLPAKTAAPTSAIPDANNGLGGFPTDLGGISAPTAAAAAVTDMTELPETTAAVPPPAPAVEGKATPAAGGGPGVPVICTSAAALHP